MNLWPIVLVLAPIGAAVVAFKRGAKLLAAVFGMVALLPLWAVLSVIGLPLLLVAVAGAALLGWHRWTRSSATVTRWGARSRRKAGVASTLDVVRHAGGLAMRRRAGAVRPSLAGLGWRDRLRLPVVEVAVRLCRAGLVWVWSSIEDVTLIFGGPRTGKSGWLAGQILDSPGAALVASTRTDLHDLTAARRAARGPVWVFNAVGLGRLGSTVTFNPVDGCGDPVTAAERATDMLTATTRASGSGDREFWDAQGRRVLAALLHAAALGDRTMRDVLGWLADPAKAAKDVTVLLRRSPEPAFELDLGQFLTTNDRTRSSITSTIMPALGWLTSPAAAAAAGLVDEPGHTARVFAGGSINACGPGGVPGIGVARAPTKTRHGMTSRLSTAWRRFLLIFLVVRVVARNDGLRRSGMRTVNPLTCTDESRAHGVADDIFSRNAQVSGSTRQGGAILAAQRPVWSPIRGVDRTD